MIERLVDPSIVSAMSVGGGQLETRAESRPFVGRVRQQSELDGALDHVLAGEGSLVFLSGEPGIGKTRLLDRIDARATARGARVAWGRCWESGAAPAYFPFQAALASLWRALPDEERRALATPETAPAGQLVPGLSALVPTPPAEGDAARARFLLFEAVAALLRLASRRAPVMLALDDLHDADRSSLALLSYLARDLRSMAVLIVGTYRDVEARLSPEVGAELTRIGREGVTLALPRLDRDESAALARALAGEVDGRVAETLYRSTQGNPLFISELLRSGEVLRAAGDGPLTGVDALPNTVREVVRQRLALLPPDSRTVLEAAAALGDEFSAAGVAEALGCAPESVEAALASAAGAGMLVAAVGAARRHRFAHALFREALYRDLTATRRRELHAAILAALERRHQGDPRAPFAGLAYHALEAGPEHLARAVALAARAADAALDLAAYEDALGMLERADAQVVEQSTDARLRGESLLALGLARWRAGDARGGKETCRQVAALARAAGDGALFARAALGAGAEIVVGLVDPVLVGLLEEALKMLPPGDSPLRVSVLARLAGALQPAPDPEHPIALAREAIAAARRLGDEATLLGALHSGMAAMMDYVSPAERAPLNREIEALAERRGDRVKQRRAHARLVFDQMLLGDLAGARAHVEAYGRLADETRLPHHRWRTPLMRAMLLDIEGRFSEARAAAAAAAALMEAAGDREGARVLATYRQASALVQTDFDAAREATPLAGAAWADIPGAADLAPFAEAAHAGFEEDVEAARRALARLPPESFVWGADMAIPTLLAMSVALVGNRERAAWLLEKLRPFARTFMSSGMSGYSWIGAGAYYLGLLAASLERWDEADAFFVEALDLVEPVGARPAAARVRYDRARLLLARGRAEDRARAEALLDDARREAEALGMAGLVQLIARRRNAGGGRPVASVAPASTTAPLTLRREGEYWSVEWSGAPVRLRDSRGLQILATLVASPGRDFHALDLASPASPGGAAGGDAGDAGELLDDEARAAYRDRIEELRDTITEAESFGDAGRRERAQSELDALTAELSRAVGLGGRARRAGSAAERARVAVQRRLKDALARIEEAVPELGHHLARTIYTGAFCAYRPDEPRHVRD
jgi:tetratricopeptide (TPR) repeat protein